jgi:hypothetical protein
MKPEIRTPSPRFSSRRPAKIGLYIAELVQECRVQGIKRSLVWVNIHIIKAKSAEEAYAKAIKLGREHNSKYKAGEDARPASWTFRGLRQLLPVYEKIADGSEIMFEGHEDIKPSEVKKMVRPKRKLVAFLEEHEK